MAGARDKPKSFRVPAELVPTNAVDITLAQNGKLWKVLLHPGDEKITLLPRRGNLAMIHYKCWLATDPEKKIFDSSSLMEGDDEPVVLNIGHRQVVKAIDVGVSTMTKKWERALFIAHYDYAFGRYTSHKVDAYNIPNESVVCVEVELVDIEDGTKMKNCYGDTVTREIVELANNNVENADQRMSLPLTTNSLMFVQLEGYKVNKEEENEVFLPETVLPFTPLFNSWGFFQTGETEYPIPGSLGPLLKALMEGDKIRFTLSGDKTFMEDMEVNGVQIKAGESVMFLVCVEEVEELYDSFILSLKEKVDFCDRILEQGLNYFNRGCYEAAACKFTRVREYLRNAKTFLKKVPQDLGLKADHQLFTALCKLAGLYWNLPLIPVKDAIDHCSDAITLVKNMMSENEKNAIGLFLRGDVPIMEAYRLRARLYEEVCKEHDLAAKDLASVRDLTEECIAWLEICFNDMMVLEHGGKVGAGARKNQLQELAELRSSVEKELKESQGKGKKKGFELKYVPPK